MEKREKLLAQVRQSKRNTPPETLWKLMEAFDFVETVSRRGAHSVFFQHREHVDITASMATKRNPVRIPYVCLCLDAIDALRERIGIDD